MKRLWLLLGLSGFSLAVQAGPQINVGTVYD
ncbi:pilus assembly protein, partial [Pseudomonas sp. FW215-R4]